MNKRNDASKKESAAPKRESAAPKKERSVSKKKGGNATQLAMPSAQELPQKEKTITPESIWKNKGPPPNDCIIVLPDLSRWISRNEKWYKLQPNYSLGPLHADDSLMLVDPINIIPGEKCTCGRPKTEFEKIGIFTYGDYLKKCTIKGSISNPFGKSLNYADSRKGLAVILKGLQKPADNYYSVSAKKANSTTIDSFIIN
jgi:hypothetical protein